ncbi:MAG TPA: sugar phosphate isomerase/epimerase family protein [Gemmataceae bacterium]|nr:sugar phosphate isomerase/epimerase family protein [Gemmataceae bacterium]
MSNLSRRDWLAACTASALAVPSLNGIEPIARLGTAKIKLSLAAYSFRQSLDLKKKPKPDMTLFDLIDFAAEQNIDAVELTAYYFPETTPEYLARLKSRCTRLGLDVSGTAVGNDFCVKDPEKLKTQLAMVKSWVEHTSRLGGKTIRIFAGSATKGDEERARDQAVATIQEACDHAAKYGIYLALENHGGITATADQMLAIVKAVKHDHFGVNWDTGNFHTADPYAELERIAPYAVVSQVKTEVQPEGKGTQEADLARLIQILRKVNFRGYVALEYEAKEDAKVAVPRALGALKKLVG